MSLVVSFDIGCGRYKLNIQLSFALLFLCRLVTATTANAAISHKHILKGRTIIAATPIFSLHGTAVAITTTADTTIAGILLNYCGVEERAGC